MELLIGCGHSRQKVIDPKRNGWTKLVTLDINPATRPDVVYDLELGDLPFKDGAFDEIHAYEVLEHTGQQGDIVFFFHQFEEFHRVLKAGGLLVAKCPRWDKIWAWGDPGHKRVLSPASLVFLDQSEYKKQVGDTDMRDYRRLYKADFRLEALLSQWQDNWGFILKAIK